MAKAKLQDGNGPGWTKDTVLTLKAEAFVRHLKPAEYSMWHTCVLQGEPGA